MIAYKEQALHRGLMDNKVSVSVRIIKDKVK